MSTTYIKEMAAARRDAQRMVDSQLLKEFRHVASFTERPPIRVAYLQTLGEEIENRGLLMPA